MYCVRCGRLAREGEKRCPECGMRLVSPAKLERLLEEDSLRRKQNKKVAAKHKSSVNLGSLDLSKVKELLSGFTAAASDKLSAFGKRIGELKEQVNPSVKKLKKRWRRFRRRSSNWIEEKIDALQTKLDGSRNTISGKKTANRAAVSDKGSKKVSHRKKGSSRRVTFTERNLRTIVAMTLIGVALSSFLIWGTFSASGMRTFASLGMGSAKGYILLGDDYMNSRNYLRAVEAYYTALDKNSSYDAAYRLARAYSYTGDIEKCVSALMYCADNYPGMREPYVQLAAIYPNPDSRPDAIRQIIARGNAQFGLE